MNVINKSDYPIDYEQAVNFMDDDLREELHDALAPCSEQEFFTAYEDAHERKFGEAWFLSEANPTW